MLLNYGVGHFLINTYSVESENELLSRLEHNYKQPLLLTKPEYYSEYMIISCSKLGSLNKTGIGVFIYNGGFPVFLMAPPKDDILLIGYNENVALIDLNTHQLMFDRFLSSPVVFCKCYSESILVLAEIDIYLFSYNGELLNSMPLDGILEKYNFLENSLNLLTDQGEITITLSDFGVK